MAQHTNTEIVFVGEHITNENTNDLAQAITLMLSQYLKKEGTDLKDTQLDTMVHDRYSYCLLSKNNERKGIVVYHH